MRFAWLLPLTMLIISCSPKGAEERADSGYIDQKLCANCHPAQAKTYAQTGMGRSFRRASVAEIEGLAGAAEVFVHSASERSYRIQRRGEGMTLRRWQVAADGKEANAFEASIDYVMGSGNHSRTFLHRNPDNRLVELPVSWYADGGGKLRMSPGYDSPAHPDFRRKIAADCFACHNAYPSSGANGVFPATLPEGIDCQRCHGPGKAHFEAAQSGLSKEAAKAAIVNPAKLSSERQMEVCMQCHLETTSFELPNALRRSGEDAFSYRPGHPLGGHQLQFDHAPGTGHDDKFEIAGAAYRLRKSACFLKSQGELRCTTCHNPHETPRGEKAVAHFAAACLKCHETALRPQIVAKRHSAGADCASCHMPKRRTEDVVHVVMTDHLIQRRIPPGDLLAAKEERHAPKDPGYRGEVVLYYPRDLAASADKDHYLALAQVAQGSNLKAGIGQLERAAETHGAKRPEIYVDLAAAYATDGQTDKALAFYRKAPKSLAALRGLGSTLLRSGDTSGAVDALKQAISLDAGDAASRQELGRAYFSLGRREEAIEALASAVKLDPDLSEARDALGNLLAEKGDAVRAELELREAIRRQPDFSNAYNNLAKVLMAKSAFEEAEFSYRKAISLAPGNVAARLNYASALAAARRFPEAETELEGAVRFSPDSVEARETLGSLYARRSEWGRAADCYRNALRLRPKYGRANLGLGMALGAMRDLAGARAQLQIAAADADPAVRQEAVDLLNTMPR